MARPLCAMTRGWGGKLFDSVGGFDTLKARIAALGIDVLDCQWDKPAQTVLAIEALCPKDTVRLLFGVGVSCGANVQSWLAKQLQAKGITVAYDAWIQPSRWCVSGWMPPIPGNVKEAFIIYGSCLKTLGLGCYCPPLEQMPVLAPPDKSLYDGKKRIGNQGMTIVSWRFVDDLHPADYDKFGVQNPILADMNRIMGANQNVEELIMKVR